MPSVIWINQFAALPSDGGGTRHFELGRELVRRGWLVTIFASDFHLHTRRYLRRAGPTDRTTKCETHEGVELRWLWAAPYERNNWRRAWNWWTFHRSAIREARSFRERPDIVIGSSPQIFAATAGRAIARRAGVPFVLEVRDLWPESLVAAGGGRGLAYHCLQHVADQLYRDAERVLVLARGTRDYLERRGIPPDKLVIIPNGVDIEAMTPARPKGAFTGRDKEAFTVIYAGAHGPANGLECVLDAAELIGPGLNVRFLLVGDGPVRAALRADASRRGLTHVEFRDPVAKTELLALLHQADAGLMVLKDSALFSFGVSPNKLFDYMAAGLPIVCNVSGEVADMVAAAGAGVQAADASAAALAAGIRVLARLGAGERARIGEAARRWVEREHSRPVLGERLDSFLRTLLAAG